MPYLEDKKFPPLFSYFHQGNSEGVDKTTKVNRKKIQHRLFILSVTMILFSIIFSKVFGIGVFNDKYIDYLKNNHTITSSADYPFKKIINEKISFPRWKHSIDMLGHNHIEIFGKTNYNFQVEKIRLKYFVDLESEQIELIDFEIAGDLLSLQQYQLFIEVR